jgi:hypothetical protein
VKGRVRFDGKRTSWLVRGATKDGRYVLCTCALFGKVHYTIVDNLLGIRGPMNVIGGGLSIFTTSGPDEAIDRAIAMLEADGGWEVSHRNRVRLNIESAEKEGI